MIYIEQFLVYLHVQLTHIDLIIYFIYGYNNLISEYTFTLLMVLIFYCLSQNITGSFMRGYIGTKLVVSFYHYTLIKDEKIEKTGISKEKMEGKQSVP